RARGWPARAARRARPVARCRLPHRRQAPGGRLRRGGRDPADAAGDAGARRAAVDARRGQHPRQPVADRGPEAVPRGRAHRAARRPARADRAPARRRRRDHHRRVVRPAQLPRGAPAAGGRSRAGTLCPFHRGHVPAGRGRVERLQPAKAGPHPRIPTSRGLSRARNDDRGRTMSTVIDTSGKGRNVGTNIWLGLLVLSLLVFGANTAYSITKAQRLGGASSAASNLQVNSQRLANQGRDAVGGDAQAFAQFRETRQQTVDDVRLLNGRFGDQPGVSGPMEPVTTPWWPLSKSAEAVIAWEEAVTGLAGNAN